MNYIKLASSRPAQAVGYPAQSRGPDGDGGVTAGDPQAGAGAVRALGSHHSEIPPLSASPQSALSPNHNLHGLGSPPSACTQRPGPGGGSGTPPGRPGPAAIVSPVRLKPHKFRFGTWNMNGREYRKDSGCAPKSTFAEELLILERIDVLVLTETHSVTPVFSKKVSLLAHTGLTESSAGVALISHANSGWSCLVSRVLVPGHAILVKLHHSRSTESLWLLGVYGDISSRAALISFYRTLKFALARAVSTIPDWSSCFATGDWNFVAHPDDRSSPAYTPVPNSVLRNFSCIQDLCLMKDSAGLYPLPSGWTFKRAVRSSPDSFVFSRLDRIYCPQDNWFPDLPVSLPTLWSDHNLVWVDCTLSKPRVQMAVPADRLPNISSLDDEFWASALSRYRAMVASPVSLPRWTAFKKEILSLGLSARRRRSAAKGKNWLATFRGDPMSPEDFDSAMSWLHHKPPARSCRDWSERWPAAAPLEARLPSIARLAWIPTPVSPWASSTKVKVLLPPPSRAVSPADPPACRPGVIERALLRRMLARQSSAKRRLDYITSHHTSEWYNLSSNKEVDERGSRASISVDGLRLSERHRATPILGEMVQIARRYFFNLHTPEPYSPARSLAQSRLLDEVSAAYSHLPPPLDVPSGPFSVAETPPLHPGCITLPLVPTASPSPSGSAFAPKSRCITTPIPHPPSLLFGTPLWILLMMSVATVRPDAGSKMLISACSSRRATLRCLRIIALSPP